MPRLMATLAVALTVLIPAFAGAVEATVIPYCSPRDSTGRLETSTVAMLQHETKRIAKALA